MGTIVSVLNLWNNLDIEKVSIDTLIDTEQSISEKNQQQLIHGNSSIGLMPKYRNPIYAQYKKSVNPNSNGRIDLKLTGGFYQGMKVNVSGDKFRVDSTDTKRNELVERYGEEIFGLSDESLQEYTSESFAPVFFNKLRKEVKQDV